MDINFSNFLHCRLGGYVNKQNCRIWSSEDAQVIKERPLHTEEVTDWCVVWSESMIRVYDCHRQLGTLWSYENRLFFDLHFDFNSIKYVGFIFRPRTFPSCRCQRTTKIMRCDTIISDGNMCQKVVENYIKRINVCNSSRDVQVVNDVVFHT